MYFKYKILNTIQLSNIYIQMFFIFYYFIRLALNIFLNFNKNKIVFNKEIYLPI